MFWFSVGILAASKVPLVIFAASKAGISEADRPLASMFISANEAVIPKLSNAYPCWVAVNP